MAKTLEERIELKFNIPMLDRVIIALLTALSNKKFVKNVKELFSNLTLESYAIDFEKQSRVYLINKMSSLILEKNITTKEALLSELNIDGKYYEKCVEILNDYADSYLSPEDLGMIDETVSNQLKYGIIEKRMDQLVEAMSIIKAEAYENFEDEMDKVENMVSNLSINFKDVKESINESKYDIDLSDDLLVAKLQELIDDELNPSHKIKTGIQMFNTMLGGGFEAGRLYCLGAVAKGFKSGLMLNIALWAKKYNKFKTKDPSKVPVIVYLSMENTIKETLKRTCVYSFGDGFKFSAYSANQIQKLLQESDIASKDGANVLQLYRPDKSISTDDLNGILDDLEKEGKECVMLILDYMNRIRPSKIRKNSETRFELSDISNELSTIAKVRDIPVVTATQMNREAFRILEDATTYEEKVLAASRMGASQVGESINIVQNVDMFIILNRLINTKKDENGLVEYEDKFLLINCVASRGNTPEINKFQIRFAPSNSLRLVEDVNEKSPLSIVTMEEHIKEQVAQNRSFNQIKTIRRTTY